MQISVLVCNSFGEGQDVHFVALSTQVKQFELQNWHQVKKLCVLSV